MPGKRGATTAPKQAEAILEQFRGSTNTKGADATGRELDGKCHSVKSAAAPRDDRRIDIAQRCAIAARRRPLHEKLRSGISERFQGSQAGILGWTLKCIQHMDVFAFHPEHLAAGRQ